MKCNRPSVRPKEEARGKAEIVTKQSPDYDVAQADGPAVRGSSLGPTEELANGSILERHRMWLLELYINVKCFNMGWDKRLDLRESCTFQLSAGGGITQHIAHPITHHCNVSDVGRREKNFQGAIPHIAAAAARLDC